MSLSDSILLAIYQTFISKQASYTLMKRIQVDRLYKLEPIVAPKQCPVGHH